MRNRHRRPHWSHESWVTGPRGSLSQPLVCTKRRCPGRVFDLVIWLRSACATRRFFVHHRAQDNVNTSLSQPRSHRHGGACPVREQQRGGRLCQADKHLLLDRDRRVRELLQVRYPYFTTPCTRCRSVRITGVSHPPRLLPARNVPGQQWRFPAKRRGLTRFAVAHAASLRGSWPTLCR